jgi:hypothetical protein
MDFLAEDGARVLALYVLSGIVLIGVAWEWLMKRETDRPRQERPVPSSTHEEEGW